MERKKDVRSPVDDEARRLARRLVRGARFAALATLTADDRTPLASRVLVACDATGDPLLLVSALAAHAGALAAHPRCSLLFGEPSDGDPLASPRISVFGEAEAIAAGDRDTVRGRFLSRHPTAGTYCDFADFRFLRVRLSGGSLNAGFARAYDLSRSDLADAVTPELHVRLLRAAAHMNEDHVDALDAIAATQDTAAGTGWRIVSADARGFELGKDARLMRVEFERTIAEPDDIRPALVALARSARTTPGPSAPG